MLALCKYWILNIIVNGSLIFNIGQSQLLNRVFQNRCLKYAATANKPTRNWIERLI